MKTPAIKVFQCEFCDRLGSARSTAQHEIRCSRNPENDYKCYSCVFGTREEMPQGTIYCRHYQKQLKLPTMVGGGERCPKECEFFVSHWKTPESLNVNLDMNSPAAKIFIASIEGYKRNEQQF